MERKRIVVKVGTSSLTYPNGRLCLHKIESIVRQIADVVNAGHEVVLVSSGAIGAGMSRMGLEKRPESIPERQAMAAVGQGILMQLYAKLFGEYAHVCAQVLLTAEDLQQRQRYLNCRHTLETLLNFGVIPVINENDSVAVEEVKFGDNDRLSAQVASLVSADLLLILTNIDGVYDKDPQRFADARLISVVDNITEDLERAAGGASQLGTGGMVTKLLAARIACSSGIPMIIANSGRPGVIRQALAGESVGTYFRPKELPLPSRKRWMAFYTHPRGRLAIDRGAVEALRTGHSLLPIGVRQVEGDFASGDLIQVTDLDGREVARGLTNYSTKELKTIQGKSSVEIGKLAGEYHYTEVIHRDNLVLTDF